MKKGAFFLGAALQVVTVAFAAPSRDYPRTDGGAVDIDALVTAMTLEEKIGQLTQILSSKASAPASSDSTGAEFDSAFLARVRAGRLGALINACGMEKFNLLQKVAVEESRLGIPLFVGHDMIHGCTVGQPIPLAFSCAFDDDLWRRIASSTALNARTKGCHWTFAPMVDVSRDARWGRIAEGPGQDPVLAQRFAAAQVRGFQGEDPSDSLHIAACLKHFAAYGATIDGRDYNDVELGESTLRDVYLSPFRAGVAAGALTVMPAFNGLNGIPCTHNRWLLTDVLRGEFGFRGMTISDWAAVSQGGPHGHAVFADDAALGGAAVRAGLDMEMVSETFLGHLADSLRLGFVTPGEIDTAVRRVLFVKRALGLFEKPYFDSAWQTSQIDEEADFALAREAARKSVVLLKNTNGILPLKKGQKVAVVGDIAADGWEMRGCWASFYEKTRHASLVDGLVADGMDVTFAAAYSLTGAVDVVALETTARSADLVVAAFGEYNGMSGESTSRADISLPGRQLEALRALKATGKPVVAVLFNGRPLALPELAEAADALVEGWFLGASAGWGIADVMTGAVEPWGRLTVDFPTRTGECPKFYNRSPTGRPHNAADPRWTTHFEDTPDRSVFPFGFGLTYTTFSYSEQAAEVKPDGRVVLSCTITNTGMRKGTELVQAYVRARSAARIQPRRSLKDWRRVELAPGEKTRVEIELDRDRLGWHEDAVFVAGRGSYDAWLSPDSDSGEALSFVLPFASE